MLKKILDRIPYKIIKITYEKAYSIFRFFQEFERKMYAYYMQRLLLNMKQEEQ